jgi:hypothetical protein
MIQRILADHAGVSTAPDDDSDDPNGDAGKAQVAVS